MPSITAGVYVSSTWLDLRPERAAVERVIHQIYETKYIGMEYFGSRDESTNEASLDLIDRGDVYVGIIGGRYGSGITEKEYDRAMGRGLPCLIYVKEETETATFPNDAPNGPARLAAFKEKLRAHTVTQFGNADQLAAKVATDLHNWLVDRFLKARLEDALSGQGPAWDAQALVRAVKDAALVPEDLRQRLGAAGLHLFSGTYERLRDAYIPADAVFRRVGAESFRGREWLMARLDAFLQENDRGYFVLEAAAGLGKTAFLAHLVRQRGYVQHFAETSRETGLVLRSLAAQVILACDLSGEGIPEVLPPIASQPAYFAQLLEKASEKLGVGPVAGVGDKLVIVVDGLDEAIRGQETNAFGLPEELPKGIYFVVSKRPVPVGLRTGSTPRAQEQIHADGEENLRDLRAWLEMRVREEPILTAIRPASEADFVAAVVDRSEGVWVYAHYLLAGIAQEGGPIDLNALPRGLWEYYAKFWQRWRDNHEKDWNESDLKILSTLAAVQEDATAEFICAQAEAPQHAAEVRRRLEADWRAFVIVTGSTPERFRLYHASLREFFEGKLEPRDTGDKQFSSELAQATKTAHARLAEHYLTQWGGLANRLPKLGATTSDDPEGGYGRRWVATHLEMADRADELHLLLQLERKGSRGRWENLWYRFQEGAFAIPQFAADVARAWSLSEASGNVARQVRYALMNCSVNSAARNVPRQLIVALVEKGVWTHAQGLLYAREASEARERAWALVELAAVAPAETREQVEREARHAMRALGAADALFAEIALSADPLDPEILSKTRQFTAPWHARFLVQIAERTRGAQQEKSRQCLQEAFEVSWPAPRDEEQPGEAQARLIALAGIFPSLEAPVKNQVFEWALGLVQSARQPSGKIEIRHSIKLMLFAPGLAKMGLAREILEAELAAKHDGALADVAPYLSESDLRRALAAARSLKSDRALAGILPRLAELGHANEALRIALKLIVSVHVAGFSMVDYRSWDMVIRRLATRLPAANLREALEATPEIGDSWERRAALTALIGTPIWTRIARRAMVAVIAPLTSVIAMAMGGHVEPPLFARTLRHIAAAGLPRVAIWLLVRLPNDHRRFQALEQVASHLPEPLVGRALEIARGLDGWSWDAMAAVAVRLPESLTQQVFREMTQAEEPNILSTEKVLMVLILRLAELGHTDQAWAALPELKDDSNRALAMGWLARFVLEPQVRELLRLASAMSEESSREAVVKGAAIRLAELGFDSEAISIAAEIASDSERAAGLRGVSMVLAARGPRKVKPLWDKTVVRLAGRNRAKALKDFVAVAPLIQSLGGAAAIPETADAIRSVGRWWP